VAAALLLTFSAGCFGGFNLTRKVWGFNNGVSSNKFVKWLVFLGLSIIPVYEICALLADPLIFNSVEFWTGSNPITVMNDGPRQVMARRTAQGVQIQVTEPGKAPRVFDVEVNDQGAVAREGTAVVSRVVSVDGDATLFDGSGRVFLHRSAAQIDEAAQSSPRQILTRLLEQDQSLRVASK
jgi:hypothetical protein